MIGLILIDCIVSFDVVIIDDLQCKVDRIAAKKIKIEQHKS